MSTAPGTVSGYVYVIYIRARSEQVWEALTSADLTARFWGHANVSDWQRGSRWEHRRTDGSGLADVVGRVLEAQPPTRLVITFEDDEDDENDENVAPEVEALVVAAPVVTFLVEPHQDIVRVTVTHERLPDADALVAVSQGWPAVLSNLKTLLETGDVLPQEPWSM